MNSLISIRTNIYYQKVKDDFEKSYEIILLVDQPEYRRTNDGEIIRERGIQELRFLTSVKGLDSLIDVLEKIKTVKDEELI